MEKKLTTPIMVAPMMGWTTRHYRYFLRLISEKVGLFTEMITTGAILNNRSLTKLLGFDVSELPLSIQLGGSIAYELAQAAKLVAAYGYTEINLNVGCPSNKVQSGCFGAVLFKNPSLVAECIAKMIEAVAIPVTVKTRIGVDDVESYDFLASFIETVSEAGCKTFIIHARKAWLSGLSPKANRTIPPLNYAWVYQIKREFPHLNIVINGDIRNLAAAYEHLDSVDGVMIGRAAWHTPYLFRTLDLPTISEVQALQDRVTIVQRYIPYAKKAFRKGENLAHLIQPLFGLFHGVSGAKQWRRSLTQMIQLGEDPTIALQKILKEIAIINN